MTPEHTHTQGRQHPQAQGDPGPGGGPGGSPGGGDHVRVVLLGGTGHDAPLRDDASIEMIRARTPLEAVGEVAAPPASARTLPTVLVVGRGGEPSEHSAAFLSAVREANPSIKLIRVDQDRNGAAASGVYDAVLDDEVSPEAIWSVLDHAPKATDFDLLDPAGRVLEAGPGVEQTPLPDEHEPPLIVAKRAGLDPDVERTLPGDAPLLDLLSADRDIFVRAAMAIVRERTGTPGLEFVGHDDSPDNSPGRGTVVASGKRRYGSIRGEGATHENLAPHAAWLGGWLALHDRQRSLRRAAFTDPLTGAWNRRYFDGFLASALRRAGAARRTVTVLVFDVDGFKQYNDRFGHPAGDEILIETVKALKSSVRPSDRVCRIGGDEFAVVFDDPDGPRAAGSRPPESVLVLAKRVQRQIAERKFPKLGLDAPGELTVSGGLAAFPWDGHDAVTLLEKADELACQSKRQGKNAITLGPGAARVCRRADDPSER